MAGQRRRRASADGLTIITWRDIPSQVSLTAEGTTAKELLEPRFQHAIDRAAAVAELTDSDLYVAEWRRAAEPLPDGASAANAATLAAEIARELERQHPRERLERLVAGGGLAPDDAQPDAADNANGTSSTTNADGTTNADSTTMADSTANQPGSDSP